MVHPLWRALCSSRSRSICVSAECDESTSQVAAAVYPIGNCRRAQLSRCLATIFRVFRLCCSTLVVPKDALIAPDRRVSIKQKYTSKYYEKSLYIRIVEWNPLLLLFLLLRFVRFVFVFGFFLAHCRWPLDYFWPFGDSHDSLKNFRQNTNSSVM